MAREADIVPHMIKKHEGADEQNIEKAGMEHAPPPGLK
jgi:hypothetical protein